MGLNALNYALQVKGDKSIASGFDHATRTGDNTFSIYFIDGSKVDLTIPLPKDGKDAVDITDVKDLGDGKFTLVLSDGSETSAVQTIKGQKGDKGDKLTFNDLTDEEKASLKGDSGVSPIITENADNTDKIYKLDITTADSTFTTPNLKGADGQGGTGGSGEENTIESISVNGTPISIDENKNVDITVPNIDGLAKTEDIPTKVSELTNDSGYLTEHQDISGKVDKVDGKSLIANTEIERLASVDNYDDTQVKTQIQAVANGLMDSVGYSADYKTIDVIAKNGVKKSVNVAPIISHASVTELADVDTTNKDNGKALVYNSASGKHEYTTISSTDEKVKMDSSSDSKYLGELLDNVTITNENGELKVKKLDGQEVTITEINYLKGLTMNVMDLVNMFSNGGVKIINTPVATYAELLNLDKSSFIEGISYLVYVLTDENHDNAKTTYLVDKDSEIPTYFGFADSQRDFTTNPIDLATEITGKLGIANMDSDAIKTLFTVDDTYKTETATNNAFSTHGAKALYDELLLAIGNKANNSDLTAHKDDANIHVSTTEKDNWNGKADASDLTAHTDNTDIHVTTDDKTAWDKVTDKVDKTSIVTSISETPSDENVLSEKAVSSLVSNYAEHDEIIGENLIPFPYSDGMSKTMNGIEYTVNPDGSVTAVGTATETSAFVLAKYLNIDPNTTYILSGDLDDEITYKSSAILFNAETNSGTSYWNYGKDEPVIFTGISVLANFRIRVTKDETVNQTFYPMLEIGNIPHKYQQYKLSRNNLREDIDELKKLDDKLENQFNIASGDYITLTDSVDGNIVELGVKGNSEQKQLQGYNLIPFPYYSESGKSSGGLTFTYGDDFNITVNGTISSSYAGFAIARNIKVDAVNKKYMLIGLPTTGSGTTHKLRVRYIFPDGTTSDFTNCYNVNGDILDKKDSTYEGATMEIDLMCYDDKDNFQVRPMLVEVAEDGSYPTEYEAYCGGVPSPSPSYPQEINSVGDDGSLVVKSRGKNLIPYPYDDGVRTNVGLTMTSLPNGMVNVNGTNTGVSGLFNFNYPTRSLIKLDPSKTYAFFNPLKTDRKDQITLGIRWYLEGQEISVQTGTNTSIAAHGNSNGAVIRSGFSYAYVYLYGYNSGKTFNNVLFAPMLVEVNEDGTYPTDYEIYKSSTATIPLSEPLRSIGDVKDEITYQDGKWGVLRRTGQYVIDGTENLVLDSAHIADCGISVRMGNYTNILNGISVVSGNTRDMVTDYLGCRELDHVPYYDSSSTIDYGSGIYRTSGNIWLSFGASDIEKMEITKDLDSVKTWLSSHNITVHYPLGTPVFEPFADQTLPYLSTYDGVTYISNDDALSAEMTVKYPTTDASGVGSRNESRIAELAKDTDDKFDDVNESLSVIGKCKNLLNPTLQTTTQNGVTCTNNGDGTYTFNGTATGTATFIVQDMVDFVKKHINKDIRLVGCPKNGGVGNKYRLQFWGDPNSPVYDVGNGDNIHFKSIAKDANIAIIIDTGIHANNLVFKPMLTTDLNATYDDFVPYTGDGETLASDVAELKNDLEKNVSNIKKWTGGGTNFLQTTISDTVLLAKDLSATSTIPHTVLVTFQMAGYVLVYLVVFGSKSNFCQYTQVFSMTSDTSHAFTVKYFSFDSTERVLKATVGTEQKYINYRVTFLSGLYSNIEYI